MSDVKLIERAIESAKIRIYKLNVEQEGRIAYGHYKRIENQKEIMDVTVEALERMMPKKPDMIKYKLDRTDCFGCSVCGCIVESDDEYCRRCGQRLRW